MFSEITSETPKNGKFLAVLVDTGLNLFLCSYYDIKEALKPHHEQSVREYLRFTRYKRSECVRSVSSYFDSLIEAHLVEDTTFSTSEVYKEDMYR